ncbi:hypothetical protein OKJ48_10710 [Streptomyces kunmingensis]|uniref:Uncharacterized protein n=1 Tax=Streptomyces kunmingensis TaxID=68225 RepID=A0ABU6C971_9ACTN|nr:hypothetical protein [Streptomyces kunmingensis]MEB3960707.1 hypothetical protein [Streptomyces kunmingensis]
MTVLTKELIALGCIRDAGQRSLFIELVAEESGLEVSERGLEPRAEMVALLMKILPHQRGFPALRGAVEALASVEAADSLALLAARELRGVETRGDPALPPVLSNKARRQARELLAAGPVPRAALHTELARELRIDLPDCDDAVDFFDHLLEQNAQYDGLPPVVVLAEVTAALGSARATELRAWSDNWAEEAGQSAGLGERRERLAGPATRDASVPRALVVMIDPADDSSDRIFVRHWVNAAAGIWQPVALGVQTTTLTALADVVDRAVRHGEAQWAHRPDDGPVHIEFVLPHSLLNHDVARLGIEGDTAPLPVSLRYYVHLRSLDRMRARDPAQLRRWRARWNTFQAASAADTYRWNGAHGQGDLERWRAALAATPEKTAVILQHPAVRGNGLEALAAAVAEGVGLAAWDRRENNERSVEVLQLILGTAPAQLPAKVHQLRTQAETDDVGPLLVGRHIAFLWDDPNRLVDCEEMPA